MGDNFWKWVNVKLEAIDVFGKIVMPTYNTKVGGVTTILILVSMMYIAVIQFISVFNYYDIKSSKNEKLVRLADNPEIHNFASDNGVKFAFQWYTQSGKPIDKTYGQILVKQMHRYR